MTTTMRWIFGGLGVGGLMVTGYLLYSKSKKKKMPDLSLASFGNTAKPIRVQRGGVATPVAVPNWKNPFDMNYINDVKRWLKGKRIKELPANTATLYARQLKNAKGRLNDDEEAVAQVFKKLQDKTQVASLSRAFYFNHGRKDMWQHLRSFLSDSEMKTLVSDPVRRLPNYRIG